MRLKNILVFSCFVMIVVAGKAQVNNTDYLKRWKTIDSLLNKKGLRQSAFTEVNNIYAKAKKEQNQPQLIKALLYKMDLQDAMLEDGIELNITQLSGEIKMSAAPVSNILISMQAEWYWKYFQQNRYKIYQRTNLREQETSDIGLWTAKKFNERITTLYLASLKDEPLLKQTRLEQFNDALVKGNARYLRPTLLDLLAHRALDYFMSNEREVSTPAETFNIADTAAFADKAIFAHFHFTVADSSNPGLKALQVFQRLIAFHMTDARPDALIDADIDRIEYARNYCTFENKEQLYLSALQHLTSTYPREPAAAQAYYLQALVYSVSANSYDPPNDTTHRFDYVKALAICDQVLQQKDSSEGKTNCLNLANSIRRADLSLQTEKVNIPARPFRALVSYSNCASLYSRIIKIDRDIRLKLAENGIDDAYWKKLSKMDFIQPHTFALPQTNDCQKHYVEIKIDALPVGEYALLSSTDPSFGTGAFPLNVNYFNVSSISYIIKGNDGFVLDRDSGHPIVGASIQVWNRPQSSSYNDLVRTAKYTTDKNGYFPIEQNNSGQLNAVKIEINKDADHLFLDDFINDYSYQFNSDVNNTRADQKSYEKHHFQVFLFTDRSIYRPGQTVFFKGIALTKDLSTKYPKVIPNLRTYVSLTDANGQKIDSLLVVTNEFGSYTGKFTLPKNTLNGEFNLVDDSSGKEQSFAVEEYKRPKFSVQFDTLKDTRRLNDSIAVTALANGYAGNHIGNARVVYRVIRDQTEPFYSSFYFKRGPRTSNAEISHGETATNADGTFSIAFKAIPGKFFNSAEASFFNYRITADVTDLNGETRSGETTLTIGNKGFALSVGLPSGNTIAPDTITSIKVAAQTPAGENVSSSINLRIYRQVAPQRLIRERLWRKPDQFILTREDYIKNFPNDEYADETDQTSWQKQDKVFEVNTETTATGLVKLANTKLQKGAYVAEVSAKDKDNQEITARTFFQLYDSKTGEPPYPLYNWTAVKEITASPGDRVNVDPSSSASDIFIIQQKEDKRETGIAADKNDSATYKFVTLNREYKKTAYIVTDKDEGGFGILQAFIKNNRLYTADVVVNVPWKNKTLSVSFNSYRDKTLPGSHEEWKVNLKGPNGEKVSSELLTAMYDASLDAFREHGWQVPNIYDTYWPRSSWNSFSNFSPVQSLARYSAIGEAAFMKRFDQFASLSNIFHASQPAMLRIRGISTMNAPTASIVTRSTITGNMLVLGETLRKTGNTTDSVLYSTKKSNAETPIQPRKNFNETAFFFPQLQTDSTGSVSFSFTMPEALTKWKWMALAHTRDLAFGYAETTIVTQKQLMVQPNAPRFLREGDHLDFPVKVSNMSGVEMTGQIHLEIFDATTNQPVDGWFQNMQANQYFTIAAGQSESIVFPIQVPFQFNKPITYKITASAPVRDSLTKDSVQVGDGEEASMPVLSNRILVTETLPLNMQQGGSKEFVFQKLLASSGSETLNHHALTFEFTSNPAWYALQAIPYLISFPYECAEQTFNRYYANRIGNKIVTSSPTIGNTIRNWQKNDTSLLSNLQKNQELKSVLLQETPWVLEAKTETADKRNIAILLDSAKVADNAGSALSKLKDMQLDDGSFPWFKGGSGDLFITQYILSGIGRLRRLSGIPKEDQDALKTMGDDIIAYLDKKITEHYERSIKLAKNGAIDISTDDIQYLYARSYFMDHAIPGKAFTAVNAYRKLLQQQWLRQSTYMQGMAALALFRTGDIQAAKNILASLKQSAIVSPERGMFWKDAVTGYRWTQAPIEQQSLMIEAFAEILKDNKTVDALKTWLIQQKQTQHWETTKATADACYALLLQGTDWLANTSTVRITAGGKTIVPTAGDSAEAGTGYIKKFIDGPFVNAGMGNIMVTIPPVAGKQAAVPAWGAAYWQYFDDLENITASASGLKVSKSLFLQQNTSKRPELVALSENNVVKVGDKIVVRLEVKSDRAMQYVHLKDMFAPALEPVDVISGYKWQDATSFYQTMHDASISLFFPSLERGTFVFEYTMFATTRGNFSTGITNIECMYAPSLNAHSASMRLSVE